MVVCSRWVLLFFILFILSVVNATIFGFFNCFSTIVVPIFPRCSPLPHPACSLTHKLCFHSQSPPCCPCLWVFYTCSLTRPFPFFPSLSPSPSHLVTVSLFLISMSLVLFCSFVCFVDKIPLIGEIIWYLPFATWLISLSKMLSSSIHAAAKDRSSFFLSSA